MAYTRNTPITVESFEALIDAGQSSTGQDNPPPDAFFYRAVHDDPGGGDPTVFEGAFPDVEAVADTPLPNVIAYSPVYQLRWEVSFDGQHLWFPIGTTTHEVYVTLNDSTGQRLESMYDIAVKAALGETDEAGARSAIWNKFATRSVQNKNGETLGYYRGAGCPDPREPNGQEIKAARPLLIHGNGQCGAWVELFGNCLRIHGEPSQAMFQTTAEPDPTQFNYECDPVLSLNDAWQATMQLLINNWTATGPPSSGCPTFPYRVNSACHDTWDDWDQVDITDGAGLPGQDQSDPIAIFDRHIVVKIGQLYYDPSYGAGPFLDVIEWKDHSVAGFTALIDNSNQRRGATPARLDWREVNNFDEEISKEALQ